MFVRLNNSQLLRTVVIGASKVHDVESTREEYPCRHCGRVINVGQPEIWFAAGKNLGRLPEEKDAFMFHPECFAMIAIVTGGDDKQITFNNA